MAIPDNFVCSASENSLVSEFASYAVLISVFVWSAVADVSIPDNFVCSAAENAVLVVHSVAKLVVPFLISI